MYAGGEGISQITTGRTSRDGQHAFKVIVLAGGTVGGVEDNPEVIVERLSAVSHGGGMWRQAIAHGQVAAVIALDYLKPIVAGDTVVAGVERKDRHGAGRRCCHGAAGYGQVVTELPAYAIDHLLAG